jgi:hypothetical protein
MVELMQYKVNESELTSPYKKMDEFGVTLNKQLIESDIQRLKSELTNSINKYDKMNINALITYLKKLLKNINENSEFELCWDIDKEGLPYTYPLQLINEKEYKINLCNYIELSDDEKLIEMDITELADIIAFEIMFKDLGETHESIEEELRNCSIIGFEPSSYLTNIFKANNDNMYKLSKVMKIDDTPYMNFETKKIHDYFNSKNFKSTSYKEVVDYSCKYAATIITDSILKRATNNGIDVKILMINATNIMLICKSGESNQTLKDILIDSISIRTFGRRFMIEPDINII